MEVSCPLCDHRQQESQLAVSSYCKKCGAYLTFDGEGGIKARPVNPPDPFAHRPPQPEVDVDYSPRVPPDEVKTSREKLKPKKSASAVPADKTDSPDTAETEKKGPVSSLTGPSRLLGSSFLSNQGGEIQTREVTCFECGHSHAANIHANSSQCHKCGRLIPMEDKEIHEEWSGPIKTRGNVHIHKKGFVRTALIQCHDLIVEGGFSGDADCSGALVIRRHGRISGKVHCRTLRVEKRAKVEFLSPVEMEEGRIDGLVNGNMTCRGLLALEKKAILTGNLKVGRLTIAEGAKHNGQVRMGTF